jgi:hypothetical protein
MLPTAAGNTSAMRARLNSYMHITNGPSQSVVSDVKTFAADWAC